MMITASDLSVMMSDVLRLHSEFSKTPEKAFQRFDGVTPSGIHPILSGLLILHEESLPEDVRIRGAKTLFGHDLLEDTTADLPLWAKDPEIEKLIQGMTFTEGQDPFLEVWSRGEEVILFEFYDNIANLMRSGKRTPERIAYRREKTRLYLIHIEACYPCLEIIKIAKGLLA